MRPVTHRSDAGSENFITSVISLLGFCVELESNGVRVPVLRVQALIHVQDESLSLVSSHRTNAISRAQKEYTCPQLGAQKYLFWFEFCAQYAQKLCNVSTVFSQL